MYAPLSLILLALAGLTLLAGHLCRRGRGGRGGRGGSATVDQLRGFLYVGAVALVVLAIGVVVLGIGDDRRARAEGLAVFGLFSYLLYLFVGYAIVRMTDRPEPTSSSEPPGQPRK